MAASFPDRVGGGDRSLHGKPLYLPELDLDLSLTVMTRCPRCGLPLCREECGDTELHRQECGLVR